MFLDETNLALGLAIVFYIAIHFGNRYIHKYAKIFISVSLLIVTLVIFIDLNQVNKLIESGHISLAIFLLVMFASTFGKRNTFYKKILLVRGDLSIIGFIFLLPHAIKQLSLALYGYNFTGIIAMLIMFPLTISSFMTIRKKIRPDRWKKLHKLAYIAYMMIYIHIGFDISIHQSNPYIFISQNSYLYHVLFAIYLISKIYFVIQKRHKLKIT